MLLDTASLYFRAYFGVPESLRAPDGTPVNAVRGLLDFVARLVRDHRPDALVACMDADWRPPWRVELLPSYKAHRVAEDVADAPDTEATPDTLAPQVPVIEEVLDAVGLVRLGAAGYEADDVIGTLATRAPGPVDIVTGDRDLFQLVDDARGVRVLFPRTGVSDCASVTGEEVRARYGVAPEQYVEFAVLRGDPSDGLPGVKGVGDKTAAQLLATHGDLAGIRAAAADPGSALTPARRRNLVAATAYLDVAPAVVRVATDVPLPTTDLALPATPRDRARVQDVGRRWGLGGPLRRLLEALEQAAAR